MLLKSLTFLVFLSHEDSARAPNTLFDSLLAETTLLSKFKVRYTHPNSNNSFLQCNWTPNLRGATGLLRFQVCIQLRLVVESKPPNGVSFGFYPLWIWPGLIGIPHPGFSCELVRGSQCQFKNSICFSADALAVDNISSTEEAQRVEALLSVDS